MRIRVRVQLHAQEATRHLPQPEKASDMAVFLWGSPRAGHPEHGQPAEKKIWQH